MSHLVKRKVGEMKSTQAAIEMIEEMEGEDIMDIAERGTFDGVCTGVCMNEDCQFTMEYEPDQDQGWCYECRTNTVKSALILLGVI